MLVAGVMSGTSADGIDVALCRISAGKPAHPRIELIGFAEFPYTPSMRKAVLAAMNGESVSVASISQLHWRLGDLYAEAIAATAEKSSIKLDLVGCHGQTIYHQTTPRQFLGAPVRATWQIGEASVVAERLQIPVISDFRTADLAAGGHGAPLVPMLDVCLFGHKRRNRVLQNLGGIGNLTAIPAGAGATGVLAFDTGPGNMVIDGCMERLFRRRLDVDGTTGRKGRVLAAIVEQHLRDAYFSAKPPKSCGREQFGGAYIESFIVACEAAGAGKADIVATATALTAGSILDQYRRFVWPHLGQNAPLASGTDLCLAGGGVRNGFLMDLLHKGFEPLGVHVMASDQLGIPAQAKEGVAFALLAWLTWQRRTGNVIAATGARHDAILGKVTYA